MKVIVMVKGTNNSETGAMPDEQMLTEMGKYNEQLVKAGIMLAGEGLHPSSKGKRIKFSGSQRTVVDGPFAEAKELVAGFWIWQVKSIEEAVEWARRCPNPTGEEGELEIRQIFEAEDFGAEFTPELRAQEERLRAEIAQKQCPLQGENQRHPADALGSRVRVEARQRRHDVKRKLYDAHLFIGRLRALLRR
jgi:hypothetical protein